MARDEARMKTAGKRMKSLRISVRDLTGQRGVRPVSGGVPLAEGAASRGAVFALHDAAGRSIPVQTRALARWRDGSARWVLLDFQAAPPPKGAAHFLLTWGKGKSPSAHARPVRVTRGESVRLRTGSLEIAPDESGLLRIGGALGVRLRLTDSRGSLCEAVTEKVLIESRGPLRATLQLRGSFRRSSGKRLFSFRLRASLYAGLPFVRLEPLIIVDAESGLIQRIRELRLEIFPREGEFETVRIGGAPAGSVKAGGSLRLFQVDDEQFEINGGRAAAGRAPGWAEMRGADGPVTVALRDFRQQWPKAIELSAEGIALGLFPKFRAGRFAHMQPWYKHDYLFEGSCYRLRTGQARRWDVWVRLDGNGAALEAMAERPLVPTADPKQAIATGAWGPIAPAGSAGQERYDAWANEMFEGYCRAISEDRDYGAMNWGDWFGERRCNWGNHEYDTPEHLLTQYARTGDLRYFHVGDVSARHLSEVDVVHSVNRELREYFRTLTSERVFRNYPARPGMMHEHAVGHVGGFHSVERIRRLFVSFRRDEGTKHPYLCLDPYNLGHMFGRGLVKHYFLTGDPWTREVAREIGDNLARLVIDRQLVVQTFKGEPHAGRQNGWTMLTLGAVYEMDFSRKYLRAMKLLADDALSEQDPNCGGWLYKLYPGHCCCKTNQHVGEATFITAIRLDGLWRYYQVSGDPRIPPALHRAVNHMINDTWNERRATWRYTSCPGSPFSRIHGAFLLAMAASIRMTPDAEHRRILAKAWDARLREGVARGGKMQGKGFASAMNGLAQVAPLMRK